MIIVVHLPGIVQHFLDRYGGCRSWLDSFLSESGLLSECLKHKIVHDPVYKYKTRAHFNIINITYVNNLIYVLHYLTIIALNHLLLIKFAVNY